MVKQKKETAKPRKIKDTYMFWSQGGGKVLRMDSEDWDIKAKENCARDKEMKDGTQRWRERQPNGGIDM